MSETEDPFSAAARWISEQIAQFPSPALPDAINDLTLIEVKAYYDVLLKHHDELSSKLAATLGIAGVSDERLKVAEAEALLRANDDKKLTNAALRDAAVRSNGRVVHARLDMLRADGLKRALEQLRKDTSKRMQRLDRELYERNGPSGRSWSTSGTRTGRSSSQHPNQSARPRSVPQATGKAPRSMMHKARVQVAREEVEDE